MNTNKKEEKRFYTIYVILIYIGLFFLCCHVGKVAAYNPGLTMFQAIPEGAKRMFSREFLSCFPIEGEALKYMATMLVISGLLILYAIYDKQRNAHYKKGEESGSAKWNDDIEKYNKQYVEPIQILRNKEPDKDGKRNVAKKNDGNGKQGGKAPGQKRGNQDAEDGASAEESAGAATEATGEIDFDSESDDVE